MAMQNQSDGTNIRRRTNFPHRSRLADLLLLLHSDLFFDSNNCMWGAMGPTKLDRLN